MMGPVQVLVVGFERPVFSGEVLAELTRLQGAGIVRLVDLLLVARDEDGVIETLDMPGEAGEGLGDVAAALLGWGGAAGGGGVGTSDADPTEVSAWSLADVVPPGSTAAIALIEHLWAGPLRSAVQQAGGRLFEETWLAPADLDALDALLARRRR